MSTATISAKPGYANYANKPKIVCLCGSTRFADEFMEANFRETLAGNIVLSVGCLPRKADGSWDRALITDEQKAHLDKLHLRKIDIANEVLVINVDGYIGESTLNEIKHAVGENKPIRFLEDHIASGNLSSEDYELVNNVLCSNNQRGNVINLFPTNSPTDSPTEVNEQADFTFEFVVDPIDPNTGLPTSVNDLSSESKSLELQVSFNMVNPNSTLVIDRSVAAKSIVNMLARMFGAIVLYREPGQIEWQFHQLLSLSVNTNNTPKHNPHYSNARGSIFLEIEAERQRQDTQWGGAEGDDNNNPTDWLRYINKQLNYAHSASGPEYRERLLKVAALAVAAIESTDRKLSQRFVEGLAKQATSKINNQFGKEGNN